MRRALNTILWTGLALLAWGSVGCGGETPPVEATQEAALGLSTNELSAGLNDCTEVVGFVPVSFEEARALVPDEFTLLGEDLGQVTMIVRAVGCDSVSIDEGASEPVTFAHIGILVDSPDGTGDANIYLLWYVTDSAGLAGHFRNAGLPAKHVEHLSYVYTDDGSGTGGTIDVVVPVPANPRYTVSGSVTNPPAGAPTVPFLANWFWVGQHADVLMQTSFPGLQFGTADVTLTTTPKSPLVPLIGGVSTGFTFQYRGILPTSHMDVIVTP